MLCNKCGNELKDGEKTCSKCGNIVESKGTLGKGKKIILFFAVVAVIIMITPIIITNQRKLPELNSDIDLTTNLTSKTYTKFNSSVTEMKDTIEKLEDNERLYYNYKIQANYLWNSDTRQVAPYWNIESRGYTYNGNEIANTTIFYDGEHNVKGVQCTLIDLNKIQSSYGKDVADGCVQLMTNVGNYLGILAEDNDLRDDFHNELINVLTGEKPNYTEDKNGITLEIGVNTSGYVVVGFRLK